MRTSRRITSRALPLFLLTVVLAGSNAQAATTVHIVGECFINGSATFDPPIGLAPAEGTVEGGGPFTCLLSINGGLPEERTAELHMGTYAPIPEGVFSCAATVFTGVAVITFDDPLPGGYTAALDRFEATSQGISFWHHGSLVSLGHIDDGGYVEDIVTLTPSEATGEYVASTDHPELCMTGELATVTFQGPAPAVLTYETN